MISATPPISMADVMTELRLSTPGRAYPISLGDADVRALAGVPSGPVSLSDLLGKSSYTAMAGTLADVNDSASIGATNYQYDVPVSIVVSGGAAPFTYTWSQVTGSGSVVAANSASTVARFTISRFSEPGDVVSQVVQCIVTDDKGNSLSRTGTVTVTLE